MIDKKKGYLFVRSKLQQKPSANQMRAIKRAQKVRFDTEVHRKHNIQDPDAATTDAVEKETF